MAVSRLRKLYMQFYGGRDFQFKELYVFGSVVSGKMSQGSHHIFRKEGIKELINIQEDGNKAKPYQIRAILFDYNLTEGNDG